MHITTRIAMALLSTLMALFPLEAKSLSPEELEPIRVAAPIYKGARAVKVAGFTPKATVNISVKSTDAQTGKPTYDPRGGGACWHSSCYFDVDPPLSTDQKITATQTVDGVTSFPTREGHEVTVSIVPDEYLVPPKKEKLLPPTIGSPLSECQLVVPVNNVAPGAHIRAFKDSNLTPIGQTTTPENYAGIVIHQDEMLKENQEISADHELAVSSKSEPSPKDGLVTARPGNLPTPDISEAALVKGADVVYVDNLYIGATVSIYHIGPGGQRDEIGKALARWPRMVIPVQPPLLADWVDCDKCIIPEQSLCGGAIVGTGVGKSVKGALGKIVLERPICAGSFEVGFCKDTPDFTTALFVNGTQMSQGGDKDAFQSCQSRIVAGPGGTYTLVGGNEVLVRQVAGVAGDLVAESDGVKVEDASSDLSAEIRNGQPCPSCQGPVFSRDALKQTAGPLFAMAICGSEAGSQEIKIERVGGGFSQTIAPAELRGKKGYFDGTWDKWETTSDIPTGEYEATFTVVNGMGEQKQQVKNFHVVTSGCGEAEAVCVHNQFRAQVSEDDPSIPPLPPLKWSATVAATAQQWADKLVYMDGLPHEQPNPYGENLYGGYSYKDAIEAWGSEKACFKNGVFRDIYNGQCENDPAFAPDGIRLTTCGKLSQNEKWRCAGHYSQMVWRATTEVGCGRAAGPPARTVCRYSPPGNFDGKTPY